MQPAFTLVLDARSTGPLPAPALEQLARDAERGGLFVPGVDYPLHATGEVVLHLDAGQPRLAALVVFASPQGVGLELSLTAGERRALCGHLEAAVAARRQLEQQGSEAAGGGEPPAPHEREAGAADDEPAATPGPDPDDPDDPDGVPTRAAAHSPMVVRLRNLSVAEQLKIAQRGEHQERVLLERLYGKLVWEALLRNPRITTPEVARIAKMGALPKPLIEIILGNGGWIQVPEIRRALLGNPRLAAEHIPKLLRLLPRHELKLLPSQTAYPQAVRDWARRLLRL